MVDHGLSPRRSGRKRKPNSKYDDGAYSALDAILLSEDETAPVLEVNDSGDEFAVEAVEQVSEVEDDLSANEGSDRNVSASEDLEKPGEELISDVELELISDRERLGKKRKIVKTPSQKSARTRPVPLPGVEDEIHSRGAKPLIKHVGRDVSVLASFGCNEEDTAPLKETMDRWFKELTLPSRQPDAHGTGGLGSSTFISHAETEFEATMGWDWFYDEGGRSEMQKVQVMMAIDSQKAKTYEEQISAPSSFLIGPVKDQKLFELNAGSCLNINEGWSQQNESQTSSDTDKASRHGWAINAGAPVHCIEWVPNQTSILQYLSFSTKSNERRTWSTMSSSSTRPKKSPAFEASDSAPSTIQIWEINALDLPDHAATINMAKTPQRRLVLCMDWGHIKQMKWCPCLRDNRSSHLENGRDLGLLAIITADGKLRVLNVIIPISPTHSKGVPHFFKIDSVAFESCPPDTVCTCLTWLSPTTIAAGCANGYVGVWDIQEHLLAHGNTSAQTASSSNALPIFYEPLHNTYITHITSCYPSRPHMIITNSPDGHHRLTSLHLPHLDFVLSPRSRVLTTPPVWHDHLQHCFSSDDTYSLRAFNVRNFYTSTIMTYAEAAITSMVTSPVHTAMLIGRADGKVEIYNPVRRLLQRRQAGDHYGQIWWWHEWRRGSDEQGSATANASTSQSASNDTTTSQNTASIEQPPPHSTTTTTATTKPLSRLLTGFIPQAFRELATSNPIPTTSTSGSKAAKSGPKSLRVSQSGVIVATIHEEPTTVRAVGWNPNMKAGTWAAVGWGSGLVVVEDVAAD